MSTWWKRSPQILLPVLAVVFHLATSPAGEPLDPNSHTGRVTHAMDLFHRAKFFQAEAEFRALLDEDEKKLGLDAPETLQDRKNLAIILGVAGNFLEAEKVLQEGIELETAVLGAENNDVLEFRELLATTIAREGRVTEAVTTFREILAIRERHAKPGDITVARAQSNLGSVLVDVEKFAEAEPLLRAAQPGLDKALQPNDSAILLNRTNLAKCFIGLGRLPEAEKEQRTIVSILQEFLGTRPETAGALVNLATTLRMEKKYPEALAMARRAETQYTDTVGPQDDQTKHAQRLVQELTEAESGKVAK